MAEILAAFLFVCIAALVILSIRLGTILKEVKYCEKLMAEADARIAILTTELTTEKHRNSEVVSQKMSNLVRTGAIIENIVPIIPELPYNAKNMHHLGQPIDFIHFSYDEANGPEIHFIEVKSGNAKESKRQKLIKKAIQMGKVYYELMTINEKGITTKRVKNNE